MAHLPSCDREEDFKIVTKNKLKGSYRKKKNGDLVIRGRNTRFINHNFLFEPECEDWGACDENMETEIY